MIDVNDVLANTVWLRGHSLGALLVAALGFLVSGLWLWWSRLASALPEGRLRSLLGRSFLRVSAANLFVFFAFYLLRFSVVGASLDGQLALWGAWFVLASAYFLVAFAFFVLLFAAGVVRLLLSGDASFALRALLGGFAAGLCLWCILNNSPQI